MKKLAPGIFLFKSEKHYECLNICNLYLNGLMHDGSVIHYEPNQLSSPEVDLSIRKTSIFGLQDVRHCHPDDPLSILKKTLDEMIEGPLDRYKKMFSLEPMQSEFDWIVMKYENGSFFKNHKDDGALFNRTVSVIIYLNDDYKGGEIEFPDFDVFHKPGAGDILIFPSSYVYTHNIKEITEGVRYSVVNWYTFIKGDK